MIFLKKGPHRDLDEAQIKKIQHDHLNNISRLANAGKLLVAGPFGNDEELSGIFIMDCKDSLEAVNLVKADPAVTAGWLRFEVIPWWTMKNCVFK
ncbi:uncharacterized protein YciI [Chitinophaga niastensis]|uniref:Uncharacterized protein YciI n=2 Tax=Chitinophaga niastensis TaxID=536980 RepID=A0A2P8HNG0_CHINA|nr:uncharacterized protein YciI [Chitinophaga niastensis]